MDDDEHIIYDDLTPDPDSPWHDALLAWAKERAAARPPSRMVFRDDLIARMLREEDDHG